jgi:hypothetical protein
LGFTCCKTTAAALSDSSTRDAILLQVGHITTQLKYATAHCGGTQVFSALLHHVSPNGKMIYRLGKLVERSVGMNSSPGDSSTSTSSSSTVDQATRLQTMTPWIALCGRYLYFAGSQLLLVIDEPAAGQARGLSEGCMGAIQQVSCGAPGLITQRRHAPGLRKSNQCGVTFPTHPSCGVPGLAAEWQRT